MTRRRDRFDREQIAGKRLRSVLRTHGVATERTLEQKISDAGPYNQRIDPHVLTRVKKVLVGQGVIIRSPKNGVPWYHLNTTPAEVVQERLDELQPIYAKTQDRNFVQRVGQALEIAIFRALENLHAEHPDVHFIGGFRGLDKHDDSRLYSKIEPEISGHLASDGIVDFVLISPIPAAVEAKNLRQWIYPNRSEIKDLLRKSLVLRAVPVLIARRIPFVTVHMLGRCGVLFHETYTQIYAASDEELAIQVKDKHLLGYHDIRVGNQPDARLRRFIEEQLVPLLPAARERFDRFRDLLQGYVDDELSYPGFAARVIRRDRGEPEDGPELEEGQEDVWPGEQEDEGPDEEPGEGPDESW